MSKQVRIIAEITDEVTQTTATELLAELTTEPGWRCDHALWPDWMPLPEQTECGCAVSHCCRANSSLAPGETDT